MFRTGYEIFVSKLSELEEGKELQKEIRDAQTYKRKTVKALFSSSPEKLPDGEPLWVRGNLGPLIDKRPWRIKIISET
ncbi:MAG TPA: phenylphosphate carboxylase subunit gamma [Dehalococcoidia bacterium]|jgi:hypothetical protein|nr:phenylphosphate carboxylase subunit gamma [Dehalococcoidia bacterium]